VTDDPKRCADVGIPASVDFMTKNQIAAAQIRAAVTAQVPGVVLGDAAYDDDCVLRDELSAQELIYAVVIRPLTTVWWGAHQPATRRHRPAARAGATRCGASTHQRECPGAGAASAGVSHPRLATGLSGKIVRSLCARARGHRPRRPRPQCRMAGHRMARGNAAPLLAVDAARAPRLPLPPSLH